MFVAVNGMSSSVRNRIDRNTFTDRVHYTPPPPFAVGDPHYIHPDPHALKHTNRAQECVSGLCSLLFYHWQHFPESDWTIGAHTRAFSALTRS
jgi:hypothetical protein